jgi:hypothetical protein
MELHHNEHDIRTHKVAGSVRDKIITLHDKYLRVTDFPDHAITAFERIASEVRSQRGQEIVGKMRGNVVDIAKNVEIGLAAQDLIVGTVFGMVGMREMVGAIRSQRALNKTTPANPSLGEALSVQSLQNNEIRPRMANGLIAGGLGTLFVGLRPLTRLADAALVYGAPLGGRIARGVDAILLRQETKRASKQVFVGSSNSST